MRWRDLRSSSRLQSCLSFRPFNVLYFGMKLKYSFSSIVSVLLPARIAPQVRSSGRWRNCLLWIRYVTAHSLLHNALTHLILHYKNLAVYLFLYDCSRSRGVAITLDIKHYSWSTTRMRATLMIFLIGECGVLLLHCPPLRPNVLTIAALHAHSSSFRWRRDDCINTTNIKKDCGHSASQSSEIDGSGSRSGSQNGF